MAKNYNMDNAASKNNERNSYKNGTTQNATEKNTSEKNASKNCR